MHELDCIHVSTSIFALAIEVIEEVQAQDAQRTARCVDATDCSLFRSNSC